MKTAAQKARDCKVRVTVLITPEQERSLYAISARTRIPVSALIRDVLDAYLQTFAAPAPSSAPPNGRPGSRDTAGSGAAETLAVVRGRS